MASPAQWTWVWVNSWSWWWVGRPGMLWFMGSQSIYFSVSFVCFTNYYKMPLSVCRPGSRHLWREMETWRRPGFWSQLWCRSSARELVLSEWELVLSAWELALSEWLCSFLNWVHSNLPSRNVVRNFCENTFLFFLFFGQRFCDSNCLIPLLSND